MALGSVTLQALNRGQGSLNGSEHFFLFIGPTTLNPKSVVHVDQSTDLVATLGEVDLVQQLDVARVNAASNWQAAVVGTQKDFNWEQALALALNQNVSPEIVVFTHPIDRAAEVSALQQAALQARQSQGLFFHCLAAVRGLKAKESWASYVAALQPLTDGVAAHRVALAPQIHGNNLGVLAGRLADTRVSYADSPMRVKTGPLIGLGQPPLDADGLPLSLATLGALDQLRFTVPQWYPNFEGMYWADYNTLDAFGGDFQKGENLRVIDAASRRVRREAIRMIGDRQINSTGIGMASARNQLRRPLMEMSRALVIRGVPTPGAIQTPDEQAIDIQWINAESVDIFIEIRPFHAPKKIRVSIALDLKLEA